jgi:SNF2 family DNA or RNA helicase
MRSRLAKLLSSRSDTLIMLSATPHDGKPKSFASLMNILNPTAIANPEDCRGIEGGEVDEHQPHRH